MRRHLIMDLFHGQQTEEVESDWIKVEDALPTDESCKVKAKLSTGNEVFAYFYLDQASRFSKYGIKPCHFWHSSTHESLFNVTHWKNLK